MLFLLSVFRQPQDTQAASEEVSQFTVLALSFEFCGACSDFSDEFYDVNLAP